MEPPMGSSPTHCIAIVCLLLACIVGGGMPAPAEPPASGAASGGDSIAALPTTVRVAAAHAYLRAGPSDDFLGVRRVGLLRRAARAGQFQLDAAV